MEAENSTPGSSVNDTSTNKGGAIPKQTGNNPRSTFSRFSMALGFNPRKSNLEEDQSAKKKDKKKKKKEKEKGKSKVEHDYSSLFNEGETPSSARAMPIRGKSLPEGHFPTVPKLKKQSSSLTKFTGFVRKVSLRKLKREKSINMLHKAKAMSAVERPSPSTSDEEIEFDCHEFEIGDLVDDGRLPGSSIFGDHLASVSLPSTPEFPETATPDGLDTPNQIVNEVGEPVVASLNSESNDTSPCLEQPDNNKYGLATDKSTISPGPVQTSMNLELVSVGTLLQSGLSSAKEGGGESGSGTPNTDGQVSQLGASGDLCNTGKAFELEPSVQNPRDNRPVEFESYEKPQENVSADKPESNVVSDELLTLPVETNGRDRHGLADVLVAAVVVRTPSDLREIEQSEDDNRGELYFSNQRFEAVTSVVQDVWMSVRQNDEAISPPQLEDVAQNNPKKSKGKGKKMKTASPVTEEKKVEAAEEQEKEEKATEPPPSDTWSHGQMLESVPGSSKSETFFTPKDSPTGLSPSDAENTSPDAQYYSPGATSVTSEWSFKSTKTDSLTNGEDVMADARARLSQSLGIANVTATQNQVGDKREHLYKILVIGELGTGKTSIIKRYVHQFFSQHYRATIGVDFALKVLNWDANTIIRLQLWDIAGQERFGNMTRVYYKEAVGAFIVFDVTRAATFDAVVKWKQDLDSKVQLPDGSAIPCVLLANKCDQQKEGLVNQPTKMDEYCKERGFSGWFETSAKENINIEEAARALVTKILQNDQLRTQSDSVKDGEKFNLDGNNLQDNEAKSKCSC